MPEVLHDFAALDHLTGAERVNGNIVVERADLVAGFGDIRGPDGVEHHVVCHIHIAAVVDDPPAGTVHHGAVIERDGLVTRGGARAMEMYSVATASIEASPRDLQFRLACARIDHLFA